MTLSAVPNDLPPPRAWTHPGPVRGERIIHRGAARGRHVRIELPPGANLYDGLVQPLAALNIRNAAINLLGGECERLVFCVAPPDPTGRVVAAYTDPIDVSGAYLLAANATLGSTEAGHPLVHCHAGLRDASGRLAGGHLLPHLCVVGSGGVTAIAVSLEGFDVRVGYDPETTLSLFLPVVSVEEPGVETSTVATVASTEPTASTAIQGVQAMHHTIESGRTGRIAYARVAPNEDLIGAVEKFCVAQGFRHAFIRGSLGSLIDACLGGPNGTVQHVGGPAVEIVSMGGEARTQADGTLAVKLSGVVSGPDGQLYGGPFVAGHNPVLMTFELTLEEWLPGEG